MLISLWISDAFPKSVTVGFYFYACHLAIFTIIKSYFSYLCTNILSNLSHFIIVSLVDLYLPILPLLLGGYQISIATSGGYLLSNKIWKRSVKYFSSLSLHMSYKVVPQCKRMYNFWYKSYCEKSKETATLTIMTILP